MDYLYEALEKMNRAVKIIIDDEKETVTHDWFGIETTADEFDDLGQEKKAAALRWMSTQHKYPYYSEQNKSWHWFNGEKVGSEEDKTSNLPEKIYLKLKGGKEEVKDVFRDYGTCQEAFDDFFEAFDPELLDE